MTTIGWRPRAALLALHVLAMGALAVPAPTLAMQILDAADHAELAAEISATNVNRIALAGDRIAKVVRSPDGFAVEHDGRTGDLYLRPLTAGPGAHDPVTLFVGTERGFTYRLTLTPAARDSAQILIRNADAVPSSTTRAASPSSGEPHVAAVVRLVRAVAGREALPGIAIHASGDSLGAGIRLIETWRGSRFAALVFEAERPASEDADGLAGLAGTIGSLPGVGPVAALWLASPATGPSGGRLGVAVVETAGAGGPQ
ncbi:MAG: type-F conjugative transfer system secretin TraK [Rhodospirillales bacterium]|nr:type-F conjugative transfer system secretin TraK [Rhodospirillales bacterium]